MMEPMTAMVSITGIATARAFNVGKNIPGECSPAAESADSGRFGWMLSVLSLLARGIPVAERADRADADNLIRKLNYRRKTEVMGAGTQDKLRQAVTILPPLTATDPAKQGKTRAWFPVTSRIVRSMDYRGTI